VHRCLAILGNPDPQLLRAIELQLHFWKPEEYSPRRVVDVLVALARLQAHIDGPSLQVLAVFVVLHPIEQPAASHRDGGDEGNDKLCTVKRLPTSQDCFLNFGSLLRT
jgi:hypothetical protein